MDTFIESVNSIYPQVDKIYIVDNTPGKCKELKRLKGQEKVEIMHLNDNFGIAYAQNIGIKRAMEEEVEYIMLSDQDTIYPENYINEMLKAFSYDEKVVAVTPRFIDSNTGKSSFFIKANSCLFKKIYPQQGLYEVMLAIASGKIIKVRYLKDVGFMKEDLFIDWVDTEWCWRALKKGYKIIGNADVVIKHQHGQDSKQIGTKIITIRNPVRQYYYVRNAFYLGLYSDNLTFKCRLIHLFKSLRYMLAYPLLVEPHLTNLKYCFLGFWHGIAKRLGRLE